MEKFRGSLTMTSLLALTIIDMERLFENMTQYLMSPEYDSPDVLISILIVFWLKFGFIKKI
jgi:hypothetical protein